MRDTKK